MQIVHLLFILTAVAALSTYQSVLEHSKGTAGTLPKTLSLKRTPRLSRASSPLDRQNGLRNRQQSKLISAESGTEFVTEILFGGQPFNVSIDTGSADTWLIASNFTCLDPKSGRPVPESVCQFGATYNISSNPSFSKVSGENFFIKYESGEFLLGSFGYETVTLAGVKVPQQLVAVVNSAAWRSGDGFSSGLLGLGLPFATSLFPGTDPSADNSSTRLHYSPIMNTIFRNGPVDSAYFALSISRDESNSTYGGQLTIGSLPNGTDARVNTTTTALASASLQYTPDSIIELGRYSISVDEVLYDTMGGNNSAHYTIDSGTFYNFVPNADAAAFNALFSPPGRYIDGAYLVQCNATAPSFTVVIGGKKFPMNPLDLIQLPPVIPGFCWSTILPSGNEENILGAVFLKNVLAVFDWGNRQMSFASRVYYQS